MESSDSTSQPLLQNDLPEQSPSGCSDIADACLPQTLSNYPPLAHLRKEIVKQVEHLFSKEYLLANQGFLKYLRSAKEGYVPIEVIASIKIMKKLTKDRSLIVSSLMESSALIISPDGKNVKPVHPIPLSELMDCKLRTVLVANLPEDHSVENIHRLFGEAGIIKNITVRDPDTITNPKEVTLSERLLIGKWHALVEYDSVEAAERAVDTLNDKEDWRCGLRVQLLRKLSKGELVKNSGGQNNSNLQVSTPGADRENLESREFNENLHDEKAESELLAKGNVTENLNRKKKNRKKGKMGEHPQEKFWRTKQGHRKPPIFTNVEPSERPLLPRMPDGSRGFTMGRGRPLEAGTS